MHLERRVRALGRQLGCRIHAEPLWCPACEPPEPMPEVLVQAQTRLIDAICARVGIDALRALLAPVPRPPTHDPCPRCGTPRQCWTCRERYGRRLFAAVGLSPDEDAHLREILARCRARTVEIHDHSPHGAAPRPLRNAPDP